MDVNCSSVGANISEGKGRFHTKEFINFLYIARGSVEETKNFLILSKDLEYISIAAYNELMSNYNKLSMKIYNFLNKLINTTNIDKHREANIN